MGAFFPVLQNEPFCRFERLEPIFLGSSRTMSSGLGPPAARGEDSVCAMVWAVLCGFADSQDSHCPVGASPVCLGGWSFQQDRIGAQNGPRGAACRAGRVATLCCRSDLVRSTGERRIHPATPPLPGEWFSDLLF